MSSYYVLKIQYVNRPPETRNISAPTTAVGRESGDIVLNDPQTSGRHAEVVFQGGQVRVRDAGSTNGTWFNGQRLTDFAMEPGQWFQVGQTTLQLMAVHGAAAPGPAPGPAKTMMAMGAPPPGAGPAAAPGSAPVGWAPPGGAAPAPAPAPMAAPPAPGYPPSQPAAPGYPPPAAPGMAPAPAPGYPPPGGPGMAPAPAPGYPPPGGPPGMAPAPAPAPGYPPPGGPGMAPAPAPGYPPPGGPGMAPAPGMAPPPGMGPGPAPGMAPGQPPGMAPGHAPAPGYPAPGMAPGHAPGPAPGMGPGAMAPMGAAAPAMGAAPGMAPMGMGGGGVRPKFQGSGGELLVTVLLGMILCLVTAFIYLPWFVCKMARYIANNTTLGPTRRGELRVEFTGTGGELFVAYLVGMLLTTITFGIYTPWFICKMIKFFTDNTQAVAPDGTRQRFGFDGTGGGLFVTYLVGTILTSITFGIYMPWFLCKLAKWLFSNTRVLENEQPVGSLDFEGTGGELFVTYLIGVILISITFGIYMPWFSVKMSKYFAEGTRVTYQGRVFQGQFHGTGGELFVIMLLHGFLTSITFGIYMPWYLVKQLEFDINNREFTELGGAGAGMGGPAFQPNMPMR